MTERSERVRVLAIVASDMENEIRQKLTSFGAMGTLVRRAEDFVQELRSGETYHVVLLPVSLSKEDDWWAIWGELSVMDVRPAILVYAQTGSFQLWSGVLEAGGYDVVVEPLTDDKLKDAVLRAAGSHNDVSSDSEDQ